MFLSCIVIKNNILLTDATNVTSNPPLSTIHGYYLLIMRHIGKNKCIKWCSVWQLIYVNISIHPHCRHRGGNLHQQSNQSVLKS